MSTRRRAVVVVGNLFALCVACSAQASSESALARQLASLQNLQESFETYVAECLTRDTINDPAREYRSDPASFGGISPGSDLWPQVERIYARYRERMCRYMTKEEYESFMASEYERHMSQAELRAAIAFFSSAEGRRFQLAGLGANRAFQARAQQALSASYTAARADAERELASLVEAHRKAAEKKSGALR